MTEKILESLVWGLVAAGLIALLLSPVACVMRQSQLIAEAIKNGVDPMAAHCAITTPASGLCAAGAKSK